MVPLSSRGPVLSRRRLRKELRRLREAAGLPLELVAREMVWSVSKIVRIESGVVGISVNDTKALLGLYQASDPKLVQELLDLARDSRRRMWWGRYRDQVPNAMLDLIGLEGDAVQILHFHPSVVPGFLQTEEYARALTGNDPSQPHSPIHVAVRMERKRRLFERDRPPRYTAVFDEAVLYRRVGGSTVIRDQLNALLDYAREPNITIVILPMDTQAHPGLSHGFLLLDFDDPEDTSIAFHDQPGSEVAADSPEEVANYRDTFDQLMVMGLQGADAVALIKRARDKSG